MNVLMLNYEYPPLGSGGAAVCRDISESLIINGNSVTIITMNMSGLPSEEYVNGVKVNRVKCWRSKPKVCHPWEQMSYCISAYMFINKNFDIYSFDVIHCHFIVPTGLLALWLKRRYGIKYILTAQGSDVIGHNNARFKFLYSVIKPVWKRIIDNASVLTAPSNYLINTIYKTYNKKQCCLIPNGLYLRDYYSSKKTKSIITLCRLQESKGIQDLINAVSQIDIGDWNIYIIGDGPYKTELNKLIQAYNLGEKIKLMGYVSDEERHYYLSEAGLYFSGSWFEAMPISLLEAMASSCRIIASNIEPHRDVLPIDCIYKDFDELKTRISSICSNEPCSVVYNIDQYDWNNVVGNYEDIYRNSN